MQSGIEAKENGKQTKEEKADPLLRLLAICPMLITLYAIWRSTAYPDFTQRVFSWKLIGKRKNEKRKKKKRRKSRRGGGPSILSISTRVYCLLTRGKRSLNRLERSEVEKSGGCSRRTRTVHRLSSRAEEPYMLYKRGFHDAYSPLIFDRAIPTRTIDGSSLPVQPDINIGNIRFCESLR